MCGLLNKQFPQLLFHFLFSFTLNEQLKHNGKVRLSSDIFVTRYIDAWGVGVRKGKCMLHTIRVCVLFGCTLFVCCYCIYNRQLTETAAEGLHLFSPCTSSMSHLWPPPCLPCPSLYINFWSKLLQLQARFVDSEILAAKCVKALERNSYTYLLKLNILSLLITTLFSHCCPLPSVFLRCDMNLASSLHPIKRETT